MSEKTAFIFPEDWYDAAPLLGTYSISKCFVLTKDREIGLIPRLCSKPTVNYFNSKGFSRSCVYSLNSFPSLDFVVLSSHPRLIRAIEDVLHRSIMADEVSFHDQCQTKLLDLFDITPSGTGTKNGDLQKPQLGETVKSLTASIENLALNFYQYCGFSTISAGLSERNNRRMFNIQQADAERERLKRIKIAEQEKMERQKAEEALRRQEEARRIAEQQYKESLRLRMEREREEAERKRQEEEERKVRAKAIEEKRRSVVTAAINAVESGSFDDIEELYLQIADAVPREDFEREVFVPWLMQKLKEFDFATVDQVFDCYIKAIRRDEMLSSIAEQIQLYFSSVKKPEVTPEQARVLARNAESLLVSARAGSGKTRTICCKTALLIDRYKIAPDQILILTFNNNAMEEINLRMQNDFGIKSFASAHTFHELASKLIKRYEKLDILFDERGYFNRKWFSEFIEKIVDDLIVQEPTLGKDIFTFLREEWSSNVQFSQFRTHEDYVTYMRSVRDVSLAGEKVKSKGEKIIADYLFEHGYDYKYERVEFKSGFNYRPDFYFEENNQRYIIEFWGIDKNDPERGVPKWWKTSWKDYRETMSKKQEYCIQENIHLIELSIVDLDNGREYLESRLEELLKQFGIYHSRLSDKDIINSVREVHQNKLVELLVQFIQKAQKRMILADQMPAYIQSQSCGDVRARAFLNLASRVYKIYEEKLLAEQKTDFDRVIMHAADRIDRYQGKCTFWANGHSVQLNDIQWILIDEFQDFSGLFYHLACTIKRHHPGIRFFCVGDDWQAINHFAGADLLYFDDFLSKFQNSQREDLLINHRSQRRIVEAGNKLMASKKGKYGIAHRTHQGGQVFTVPITSLWIEREHPIKQKEDRRFRFLQLKDGREQENDTGFLKGRYIKACYKILIDNLETLTRPVIKANESPRVLILSRTNKVLNFIELKDFLEKLKACFSPEERQKINDFDNKVQILTAHRSKGLEADIVIILQVSEGNFPLIHSDNALFEIFGQSPQQSVDEERRLFYVAMTRAKEKLYLLTERENESPFLTELEIPQYRFGEAEYVVTNEAGQAVNITFFAEAKTSFLKVCVIVHEVTGLNIRKINRAKTHIAFP